MSDPCYKYLHFSTAIRKINKRYKLTEYKQVMVLEAVMSAHAEGATLSMLDLILMKEIASQATLHSITKILIDLKLIKTEVSSIDARRKYVSPTKLGFSWLNDCSDILALAAKK
ncbi:winged helix-turn-helix transcriptional regulator [Polynucleobacter sp. MWH-Creno-3A4]|uniref:MarR family winged helix-turn-helix transcriptional regulator n=1 Tax=Polynucleobacter sp. MWH-Creno-3A4 TaxID=1855886 RepID=UPI001C0B1E51|nr:MarR family winged helix-turn-helix transcriptional regulator [Polynucleobacter sp. MWH-Creno-3A4]MBU3605187.1 winged helix-turn-helix transcriptional regulator [Polynucleobacter sp. MWH-Creno-3A4]